MNITQSWKIFKDIVIVAIESCISKLKIWKIRPSWMNNDMTSKIKKKEQAYNRYLQTRDGTDYLFYTRVRNQAKTCCRKAVRNFEKMIARNAKQYSKAFFMYARSKLKTKGVADLSDGANKVSDEGKANLLNKF